MQCIKDAIGGRWLYQNEKMFKDLKKYMEEFHKTGAKLFIQLAAGMGRSSPRHLRQGRGVRVQLRQRRAL